MHQYGTINSSAIIDGHNEVPFMNTHNFSRVDGHEMHKTSFMSK